MNIGQVVKELKKDYPSASISRVRFLEKEGLIKIKGYLEDFALSKKEADDLIMTARDKIYKN